MSDLKLKTKIAFGIGDIGGNLYFSLIGFIFMFYLTNKLGLKGTIAGIIMMIGKIWDAITDPIISIISDRTTNKYGRRRPFIFIGAFLLFIFLILLFSIPKFKSTNTTFIVTTILFCFSSTAFTLVNIPYSALQPELTNNYNETTSLTSWRMSFAIIGTLLAVLGRPLADFFNKNGNGWTFMSILMGSIILITSWITVFFVKEKYSENGNKQKGILISYKEAFTNIEFLTALIPWALFVTSVTIVQGGFIYFYKYLFNAEGLFEITLFGLIIVALICLPIWLQLSKKISKSFCYIIGMLIFAIGLLLTFLLSPIFGSVFSLVVLTVSGIGFSTHYIMPNAIIPDIIELDFKRSGLRREGIYYSIWNFLLKIGQALAGLIIGVTLDIFGFIPPKDGIELLSQSSKTLQGIRLLCGPIPIIIIVLGIVILTRYPINKRYYNSKIKS